MFAYTTAVNILSDIASMSRRILYNPYQSANQMASHVFSTVENLGPKDAHVSKPQPLKYLLPCCCADGIRYRPNR